MRVTEEQQTERLKWLVNNDFILKPNYEWHHIAEKAMVKQTLVEASTDEEWDRLTDSFEYFFANND